MRKGMFIMLAALCACVGCVTYHTPPMDRRVTVAPDLGTAIWVTDVRLTKAHSQHYTLQANVVNNAECVVRMEYKVVWLDANGAEIRLKYYGKNERYTVLVTLGEAEGFTASFNGAPVKCVSRTKGTAEIELPGNVKEGVLTVIKN